jgi:hypothetical protein
MGARNGNYISALGNGTTWADTGNSQSTALIANTPYNSVVSTTNANQLYLMSMANDGRYNIFRTYYNGSQMSTRNTSNVSYTGMTLGGKYDGTNISETWNGVICEVIIYNSLLTDAQRMQVDAYLAWKWGIRSSLPDANPYKNNM